MELKEADDLFATRARIKAVEKLIDDRSIQRISLSGLEGSAPAMLFAGLYHSGKTYLIIADDIDAAGYIYHDLCQICGDEYAVIFPSGFKRDIKYGQPDPPSRILRTEALDAISGEKKGGGALFVVTCPEALAEKVADAKTLSDNSIRLRKGERVIMTDLLKRLRELGFKETDYVFEPGQFARRGSIIDVYSFSAELPFRIDFFDDEIDSLRSFNVETQLSEKKQSEISIIPPSAADTSSGHGISLVEFIDKDTPVFCQSPAYTMDRIKNICNEEFSESAIIADEGDMRAMDKVIDYESFSRRFEQMKIFRFGHSAGDESRFKAEAEMAFRCGPQTLFHKNFDLISENFSRLESEGYRLLILSDSPYQTERLHNIFQDRGDKISFTAVDRTIHEGFVDHEARICFFTDHQIFDRFHKYNLKSDRARGGKLALSLRELNQIEPGDYIVHIDHGIGKFGGLVRTDVNGTPQEMIKLLYQNDDIILVSIHALHKLSKYRGKEGEVPKINKLGSGAWNKLK